MTAPEPPPVTPQHGTVTGAIDTFRNLPRWAMFAVIAVGGLVAWYVYKAATSADTTSTTWEQNARDLLTSRGYDPVAIESALSHYQGGGTMSPDDTALIAEAIRALGTPDMPVTTGNGTTPSPVIPSGGVANGIGTPTDPTVITDPSTVPTIPDTSSSGYWYVVSLGYGWSSTLRGISQQFYGTTDQATMLLQLNPGTTSSEYARIQPGVKIKIPRSLTV
jgi:hypothetical protein